LLGFQSLNKTSLGVSNIFEGGLLFAIFALLFAPTYLAWIRIQSIWFVFTGFRQCRLKATIRFWASSDIFKDCAD
jgi:hypothetical protein